MKTKVIIAGISGLCLMVSMFLFPGPDHSRGNGDRPVAEWARTFTSGSQTGISRTTVDGNDNVYVVGHIEGKSTYTFGNGVSVTGSSWGRPAENWNAFIIKYSPDGKALWARTIVADNKDRMTYYYGVDCDSAGNVYVAGKIDCGWANYDFGSGIVLYEKNYNDGPLLVKYDAKGNTKWVKTARMGYGGGQYSSLKVDGRGNIYAVGTIYGPSRHDFGNGVVLNKTSGKRNAFLVKYNRNGTALWAGTCAAKNNYSSFNNIDIGKNNRIYIVGTVQGIDEYFFGNGVKARGIYPSSVSAFMAQYTDSGRALWARTMSPRGPASSFHSVVVDDDGSAYAAGNLYSTTKGDWGNGVTVGGTSRFDLSAMLVKFNASGKAQWARSVVNEELKSENNMSRQKRSTFESVRISKSGTVIAGGFLQGSPTMLLGRGVQVNGPSEEFNTLIAGYDRNGETLWARTLVSGPSFSSFKDIGIGSGKFLFAAGEVQGSGLYVFDEGTSVKGIVKRYTSNPVLVKYVLP